MLDTQATSGILNAKMVLNVECFYLPELCQNRNSKASSGCFDLMPLKKFVDPLPEEIAMLFMFENILLEKMKVLLNCYMSIWENRGPTIKRLSMDFDEFNSLCRETWQH